MEILKGYSKIQKIKLAKQEDTSIEMLDELINDDVEVKVEVYKRKDFYKIKDRLKNFDEEEYKFFKDNLKKGLINKIINFAHFSCIFITLMEMGIIVYTILQSR